MQTHRLDAVVNKIDDMGKGAWIGLMVLSFVLFWPAGLALLAFLIWSGRMGSKRRKYGAGRWRFEPAEGEAPSSVRSAWNFGPRPSGNSAFDEYRTETIKRLEQEQAEFEAFLERLRFAKDKEEFDQFLAGRRSAPDTFDVTDVTEAADARGAPEARPKSPA
ncbi:MAG: DUF2852 domain-containing protein [Pseudomonadota bacterium]